MMSTAQTPLTFAWLEVTGFCNLECTQCYADSSPRGTHGTMTVQAWTDCIDQLAAMDANGVQFIGGEPALYPHLADLIAHAHGAGLDIEVFSNLTHITDQLWDTFTRYGVSLATSYYSDDAADHDKVTGHRGSHTRTRANIRKAQELGLRLRGGVITVHDGQRAEGALRDLAALGLTAVGTDRTRRFGRGSCGVQPTVADLCGHCAHGKIAIGPDGEVWPCVLGRFITLGNVLRTPLADIWNSASTAEARRVIEEAHRDGPAQSCTPPQFLPMCGPCSPCVPSFSHCDPRAADDHTVAATIGTPSVGT
jgi:radical SAM protein with 4Fe4S-binding SPASM domain